MFKFLIAVLLTSVSISNGQDTTIYEYEITYNLGSPLKKTGYLFQYGDNIYFNTTPTVFLKNKLRDELEFDFGDDKINLTSYGNGSEYCFYNIEEHYRLTTSSYPDEVVLVSETNFDQEWIATNRFKTLDSISYPIFETHFRGRYYEAAVNKAISFSHGPWKFNSLPGLPVEIIDKTLQLSWKLKGVTNVNSSEIDNMVLFITENVEEFRIIDIKEHVAEMDRTRGGFDTAIELLPEKYTNVNRPPYIRGGLELVYEWE
ncbi:MAG: GLPGLI family protein [Nonlabens sp.]|nr:GLPGLI family protein [Nonlabens sp.]